MTSLLVALLLSAGQMTGTASPTSDVSGNRVKATGSTTPRALKDRAADVVNVLDFIPSNLHAGIAAGTDTTDLVTYLNLAKALAGNGKTVVFPPGKYNYTGPFTLDRSVTLDGSGWFITELHNLSTTQPGIVMASQPGTGPAPNGYLVGGQRIRSMKLTGASSGPVVLFNSQTHGLLRDVYLYGSGNAGNAITLSTDNHVWGLTVDHCIIQAFGGWGVYGRTEDLRQVNANRIIGTEISSNTLGGVSVWGTDLLIRDSIIQGNIGPGIHLNADDMATLSASARSTTVTGNYLENNRGGEIKASTTLRYSPSTIHYVLGLRIENNYILHSVGSTAGVTAAIDLDCTDGTGVRCSTTDSYRGVYLADNYIQTAGTVAFVDFHGVHGVNTRLVPFSGSEALGGLTFAQKYLGLGGVAVVGDAFLFGSGAPSSAADYASQNYIDSSTGTWYRSKGAGTGATDWLAGSAITTRAITGGNLITDPDSLGSATWFPNVNVTIDPDADGSADRLRVAESKHGLIYTAHNITPGAAYQFSFDAKNNGGSAADWRMYCVSTAGAIDASASYFALINGSTYTRVAEPFTAPANCSSVAVYPLETTTTAGQTVDLFIKNAALHEVALSFAKLASGSATVASGSQTTTVDLTPTGYTVAPNCTVTGVTANRAYKATATTTLLTVDAGSVLGGDEVTNYTCIGK